MRTALGLLRLLVAGTVTVASAIVTIVTLPIDGGRGRVFHAVCRAWARSVLRICGVRVRLHGLEKIDLSRNYVYVSNHASMFDIPAVLAAVPDQIRLVYKKELEAVPIFGWGLKWGSYIGIDRGRGAEAMKSIDEASRKIRNGASVLLYAEGTRTLDGRLQPFKRGAFNLAVRAGVPVVPLTINGSFRIMRKHSLAIAAGTVDLVLDSPIPLAAEAGKEAEVRLMNRVHAAIARHYIDQ